ncbi:MAG TPA: hypothetical protein VF175_18940 [Lacipirellula sp.]
MKFASLQVALAFFFAADVAWGVPPDQIHNSPIPSLAAPELRPNWRRPAEQQTPPAPGAIAELPVGGAAAATRGRAAQQPAPRGADNGVAPAGEGTPGNYPEEEEVDYDALRAEIWSSPEMREAREFVMEYARRSAQSSEQEGRQFLERLSQLSPDAMRSWLDRYQQQRMRLSVGRAAQENARQLGLENALIRQNETRQAFANINDYQTAAAEWARVNIQSRNEASQELRNARSFQRDITVLNDLQQDFNPFYPTFDPMTPPRRVAAAVSLPGDLPPGDPRNFIEGEEGIDIGADTSPQDAAAAARGGDPRSGPLPTGAIVGEGGGGAGGEGGGAGAPEG